MTSVMAGAVCCPGWRSVLSVGRKAVLAAFILTVTTTACTDVPREAVTLSVTVGKDLAEAHRAHRALAERYFKTLRNNVDTFVQEVYQPYIVRSVLNNKAQGRTDTMWERIVAQGEAAKRGDPKAKPFEFMEIIVLDITKQVESTRADLMRPVAEQEAEVLRAVDDTYNRLQQAQAVVTAHLASVRSVHEAQDDILTRAGVEDLRRKVIERTAGLSDSVAEILEKARRGDAKAEDALQELTKKLKAVKRD